MQACNDASNDSGQQAQAALLQLLKAAIAAMDTPPCTFPGERLPIACFFSQHRNQKRLSPLC